MIKKLSGLASLLLLITFLGASCTPAASQRDLQELQYQVQALSLSLATTQNNLSATQDALRNVQNQNQQLQEQLQQASTKSSTCDRVAQDCINNTVSTPYYSYPYSYQPICTPVNYSPCSWRNPYYYFFPHIFGNPYSPWLNYVPPCPHPQPSPCPQPHPSPFPHTSHLPFPHPISPYITASAPVTKPIPTLEPVLATYPMPAAEVTPAPEPVLTTYPAPAAEVTAVPEPVLTTYPTPADVPDVVIEATPAVIPDQVLQTPSTAITERPVIIEVPFTPAPETFQTPEATIESNTDIVPAAIPLPEITPEPALPAPTSPAVTDPVPAIEPAPAPQPTLATYPMPAAVPDQVLEAAPSAPAVTDYPVITQAPAMPKPLTSETADVVDEIKTDSTL
jgi:hypothetical protein